jgi:putative endonuclease
MTAKERRKANRRGHSAEGLAIWLLRCKGYRILARRYRSPFGEIDIVARRGPLVAFVEVKSRPNRRAALEALTPQQCRRIERASLAFLQSRPEYSTLQSRFDLIALTPRRLPLHIPDAWRP